MGEKCKDYQQGYCVVKCNAYKRIPTCAQYVNLPKYFSHPSSVIYFFATPPIKLKGGLQMGGKYQ
jgi:hypothetical protein